MFYVLVGQRLAWRNATLCDSRRAVVPVCPILKLKLSFRVGSTLNDSRFSHEPVPMYTCSVWEVILDVDDETVPLIDLYRWTRVLAWSSSSALKDSRNDDRM